MLLPFNGPTKGLISSDCVFGFLWGCSFGVSGLTLPSLYFKLEILFLPKPWTLLRRYITLWLFTYTYVTKCCLTYCAREITKCNASRVRCAPPSSSSPWRVNLKEVHLSCGVTERGNFALNTERTLVLCTVQLVSPRALAELSTLCWGRQRDHNAGEWTVSTQEGKLMKKKHLHN